MHKFRAGPKKFDETMFSTKYPQLFKKYLETMNVPDSRTSDAHRLYLNMWLRDML